MITAERILELLKNSAEPLTKRQINAHFPHISKGAIGDAVNRLKQLGCIAQDNPNRTPAYWRYRHGWPGKAPTGRNEKTTPEIREQVYRACQYRTAREIAIETGYSAEVIRISLNILSQKGFIQCIDRRWQICAGTGYPPAPRLKRPSSAADITSEDLAWHRHWHPLNRETRRRERHAQHD